MRVYLKLEKSKKKIEDIIKQQKYLLWDKETFEIKTSDFPEKNMKTAGPLWIGELYDKKLARKMFDEAKKTDFKESQKLLEIIKEEIRVDKIGSYDLHKISKKLRKSVPKIDVIMELVKKKGYKSARVHTNLTGIKTTMPINEMIRLF